MVSHDPGSARHTSCRAHASPARRSCWAWSAKRAHSESTSLSTLNRSPRLRPANHPTLAPPLTHICCSARTRTLAPRCLLPPHVCRLRLVTSPLLPALTGADPLLFSLTLSLFISISPPLSISICLSPRQFVHRSTQELLLVPRCASVTCLVSGSGAPTAHR